MSKVSVHELLQGMNTAEPIYTPDGKLLLKMGTRLTRGLINNLCSLGIKEVEIADRYTLIINPQEGMSDYLSEQLINDIKKISPESKEANKKDSMVEISRKVQQVALQLSKDSDITEFCVQMQIIDSKNLLEHGIHTAVFSMLLAGAMNLSDSEIYNIGAAALIHNIGLCEMPFLIAKETRTEQEEKLYREHPTYGYYFALQNNVSHSIADIMVAHHERFDGTGYPKMMAGDAIPIGSRIINLCSDYSDLITIQGTEPYQAIEYMYCCSGTLYDKDVVNTFTENIPVYPLGSLVRLTTKEIGIVVNVRKNYGPRPVIRIYYNRVHKPLSTPKLVDLGDEKTVFIEHILN